MIPVLICYVVVNRGRSSHGHVFMNADAFTVAGLEDCKILLIRTLASQGLAEKAEVIFTSATKLDG